MHEIEAKKQAHNSADSCNDYGNVLKEVKKERGLLLFQFEVRGEKDVQVTAWNGSVGRLKACR